jgi:hypothetical protein
MIAFYKTFLLGSVKLSKGNFQNVLDMRQTLFHGIQSFPRIKMDCSDKRGDFVSRKPYTLCVRDLDVHKINIGSRFFLGSFFIENLNLKMHLINKKTAVPTIDPP